MVNIINFPKNKSVSIIPVLNEKGNMVEDFVEITLSPEDSGSYGIEHYLVHNGYVLASCTKASRDFDICLYDGWYENPESVDSTISFLQKYCNFYSAYKKIGKGLESGNKRQCVWSMVYGGIIDYEAHTSHLWKLI